MKCVAVIPTYNERENIAPLIEALLATGAIEEILVVDDGSPDKTADAVTALRRRFPGKISLIERPGKRGLGSAYRDAFGKLLGRSDIGTILMMDADLSHDPAAAGALLAARRGADFVVGSRYVRGGGSEGWEWWRKLLSRTANLYCGFLLRTPYRDSTGGFNAIAADRLRQIDLSAIRASGYAFQIELKYRILRSGGVFAEVPITFKNRRAGKSKLSGRIIREGFFAPLRLLFFSRVRKKF